MEHVPSEPAGASKHDSASASSSRDGAPSQRESGQLFADSSRQLDQNAAIQLIEASPLQMAQQKSLDIFQGASPSTSRGKATRAGGLPDSLRLNMEALSGLALDDVRVHRNSDKPAQVDALAYAQGRDIHLGPGHERHLPHEAWHVVQQAQGRVKPTVQMKAGLPVNDDKSLENEADVMGLLAVQMTPMIEGQPDAQLPQLTPRVIQRELMTYEDLKQSAESGNFKWRKLKTNLKGTLSPASAASVKGLGVSTQKDPSKTLKSKITFHPVDKTSEEGTLAEATVLGPDHELGAEPQGGKTKVWNVRRKWFATYTGLEYVAGHLLNNNLGGPGDDQRNLTAIPATSNSLHSKHVESEVKKLVNTEGNFVRYTVAVDYGDVDNKNKKLKKIRYAKRIRSAWSAIDENGAPVGEEKTVAISVPEPRAIGSTQDKDVEPQKNDAKFGSPAKALWDPSTHVVLSNEGFLRVAKQVQAIFREKISRGQEKQAESEKALSDLVAQIDTLKLEKRKEHDDNEVLRAKIQALTDDAELREEELQSAQLDLATVRDSLNEVREELEAVHKDLNLASAVIESLKADNEELTRNNLNLIEQNTLLIAKNELLTREYQALIAANERLTEENARHVEKRASSQQDAVLIIGKMERAVDRGNGPGGLAVLSPLKRAEQDAIDRLKEPDKQEEGEF